MAALRVQGERTGVQGTASGSASRGQRGGHPGCQQQREGAVPLRGAEQGRRAELERGQGSNHQSAWEAQVNAEATTLPFPHPHSLPLQSGTGIAVRVPG